jgi:hypothetical protein
VSTQHGPTTLDIYAMTLFFTGTVERYLRAGDGTDPRTPPTKVEVARAMCALCAAIAQATRSSG